MGRYKKKTVAVQAEQYDGTNIETIQALVGNRFLDWAENYGVPNFDFASNWLPEAIGTQAGVLWTGSSWAIVNRTDWVVVLPDGTFEWMRDPQFKQRYEVE